MAAQHPVITANGGDLNNSLLAVLIERTPYVLKRTEVLSDLTQTGGMVVRVVHSELTGYAYYLNEADTTSADDGVNVLVDFDGRRYIVANAVDLNVSSVIAVQATPPGSPSDGDAYIVAASPTGAWVGHAEDIAIYTPRGWLFARALIGLTVLNEADDLNWQYDASGTWGVLNIAPPDDSVHPVQLVFPLGTSVEAQQNAPGTLTVGIAYLVGTAGSGAWAGHNNALAFTRDGSTWEFIPAYEGASVYNKATDQQLIYNGTAWAGAQTSNMQEFSTPGSHTWNKPASGNMALVQIWGGGGSGGRPSGTGGGGGGGGGAYVEAWIKLSTLGATVAVTVGAGGAARTATPQDGQAGGNSVFGTLTAYGGGGGANNADTGEGGGGGGGGSEGAGVSATVGTGGAGGAGFGGHEDYAGGAGSDANTGTAGGNSVYGGGGGGGGSEGIAAGAGGSSLYGGGGGGGSRSDGGFGAGGASRYGGAGGAGSTGGATSGSGAQPGGGGGGSESGTSGAGGDGLVRVTVF